MDVDQNGLEYALRGKAWKVYWFLLKKGEPVGVREVQRALHFSSPSVANHHLEQLCSLGLVTKQEVGSQYVLAGEVKIGVVRHYVKLVNSCSQDSFSTPYSQQYSTYLTYCSWQLNSTVITSLSPYLALLYAGSFGMKLTVFGGCDPSNS